MKQTININKSPIILIDSSYYIFYRYFATLKWFGFQQKEVDISKISENEEFIVAFTKHFMSDIQKLCKKWKTKKEYIIMCVDCYRCDIWRNKFLKDYKAQRVQSESFNRDIFEIFKKQINTVITQISSENLEADDIVAILHNEIRRKNQEQQIVLITNDNDYIQLEDEKTLIYNMQLKDITIRRNFDDNYKEVFFKALMGDKSDNIPKITTITKKEALRLTDLNNEEKTEWMNKFQYKEDLKRNLMMIDFKFIPKDLKKKCLEKIELKNDDI